MVSIASTPCNEHSLYEAIPAQQPGFTDFILSSDPYGDDAIVVVGEGPNQASFSVAITMLTHYSGHFKRIFSNEGPMTDYRALHLSADKPQIFGMVQYFMQHKRFFDAHGVPGRMVEFDEITELWDFGHRHEMPLIQNAAIDLYAEKIKYGQELPSEASVQKLWEKTPPGCTLRKFLVHLVREMWIPDGNRHRIWAELIGGMSFSPANLVRAIEELKGSKHVIRISEKNMRRLRACEWHIHEDRDCCEGSEEFQLEPEHLLMDPADEVPPEEGLLEDSS